MFSYTLLKPTSMRSFSTTFRLCYDLDPTALTLTQYEAHKLEFLGRGRVEGEELWDNCLPWLHHGAIHLLHHYVLYVPTYTHVTLILAS